MKETCLTMNSRRALQIVLPMAGLGSRFIGANYSVPKPLIEVDGMPMFKKALTSLERIEVTKNYFFIIRQEHVDSYKLDALILNIIPEATVIILPKLTRGAAESALGAKGMLNPSDGLILLDCDVCFNSPAYDAMVEQTLKNESDIDAGLLTFRANDPRYSYAVVDSHGNVIEIAEKKVISHSAITGAYFFGRAGSFVKAAETLLANPISDTMKEYYISYVYDILLHQGNVVHAVTAEQFASFGTPEELNAYKNNAGR